MQEQAQNVAEKAKPFVNPNPELLSLVRLLGGIFRTHGWLKLVLARKLGPENNQLVDELMKTAIGAVSNDKGELNPFDDKALLHQLRFELLPLLTAEAELNRKANASANMQEDATVASLLGGDFPLSTTVAEVIKDMYPHVPYTHETPVCFTGDVATLREFLQSLLSLTTPQQHPLYLIGKLTYEDGTQLPVPSLERSKIAHFASTAGRRDRIKRICAGARIIFMEDFDDAVIPATNDEVTIERLVSGFVHLRRWAKYERFIPICFMADHEISKLPVHPPTGRLLAYFIPVRKEGSGFVLGTAEKAFANG